jgi:hypothetical protein
MGGGATGVELAEALPEVARGRGLAPGRPVAQLIEAGPAILAGSSPQLIEKAPGSFLTSGSGSALTRRSPPRPRKASGSPTGPGGRGHTRDRQSSAAHPRGLVRPRSPAPADPCGGMVRGCWRA